MPRRTKWIAVFLLAVWLAATNHAIFELAGFMSAGKLEALGGVPDQADPFQKRWHFAEKTSTKQSGEIPAKPALLLRALPIFEAIEMIRLQAILVVAPEPRPVDETGEPPAAWHFAQRAAPLPGAPSLGA